MLPFLLGTYTEKLPHVDGRGPGILPGELDPGTGVIRVTGEAIAVRNPSYLATNRAGDRVYATSEITDFAGNADGAISTFAVNPYTLRLTRLQECSSAGSGPAYVRLDRAGRFLLVANYIEGNVVVFPISADGTLAAPTSVVRHTGAGPDKIRQESPHPHSIMASPDNRFVYAADLGTDRIQGYAFDSKTGRLDPAPQATVSLPPGGGPRHFVFHPNARFMFVDLELTSEIASLAVNSSDGSLALIQLITTRTPGNTAKNHPSEISITPDGRFLYVANRGHDTIAGFALDPQTGLLKPIGHWSCGGETPRHMALTPDGRFLLVASQTSGSINSFSCDRETGFLADTGHYLRVPTPCFVLFAAR